MTAERAPVPAALRAARGLVFFRLAASPRGPVPFAWRETVLARMREEPRPPPVGAVAWRPAAGAWSEDLGGRWLDKGSGAKVWEWL